MNPNRKRDLVQRKALTDISEFRGIYSGQKCFVVGAGPSLGLLSLKEIHNHVVISVNSSALLMPWSKGSQDRRFWISNDILCLRWSYFWTHVAKVNCTRIVRDSWLKQEDKIKGLDLRFFTPRTSEDHPLLLADPGLCFTSSVPTALDFALLMGCSQVYLLGVDQRMLHGKSHFWQMWPKTKWPNRSDKPKFFNPEQKHQIQVFDDNKKVFTALSKLARKQNQLVYNCSNISTLDVFPKISLEQALK